MITRRPGIALLFILATLLVACVPSKKEKDLDSRLLQYEQMVRWSQWDAAAGFIAPGYLEENPISNLDMERLRLFRVTNYTIRSAAPIGDGNEFTQVVQISMFNRNQAVERQIIDQQLWRWDEESEIWMLHSGLPDVLQRY
ncbi:MAG: hypothetical protein V2I57_12125 [Xanthomonadales bacterium]|jgi:hypothetical protein|nr:hypothetical protein [Xanthomonadales bacterium]